MQGMPNWNPQCDQPLLRSFTNLFEREDRKRPELLPNLHDCESLVIATDYAGEAKQHPFQVLTYLLIDLDSDWRLER
jgi:hypothetical protein